MQVSDEEWRQRLTPLQYRVLRQQGTEAPFTGDLLHNAQTGGYHCAACGQLLFDSGDKYESDQLGLQGWPSFADVVAAGAVVLRQDTSYGMERTEVVCKNCGGHLGHLFPDRSSPSGKHYCINSAALEFKQDPRHE